MCVFVLGDKLRRAVYCIVSGSSLENVGGLGLGASGCMQNDSSELAIQVDGSLFYI